MHVVVIHVVVMHVVVMHVVVIHVVVIHMDIVLFKSFHVHDVSSQFLFHTTKGAAGMMDDDC